MFYQCHNNHRDIHYFPTRRSSDLIPAGTRGLSASASSTPFSKRRPAKVSPTLNRARPSPACASKRRSEEHTSELQSQFHLVCRLLLEKKKQTTGNLQIH